MALNINRLHKFNDLVCELSAVKIILKIADASGGGVGSSDTCGHDKGEGVKNWVNFADVLYGCPLSYSFTVLGYWCKH